MQHLVCGPLITNGSGWISRHNAAGAERRCGPLRAALALRIDPESHFINILLEKVQLLTPHNIRLIGAGIFLKAGLDFVEGIGLAMEKTWAEWLTIALTASFLPWEVFEILRHFTWMKVGFTFINVLVLIYLIWVQQLRLRSHRRAHSPEKT